MKPSPPAFVVAKQGRGIFAKKRIIDGFFSILVVKDLLYLGFRFFFPYI